MACLVSLGDSFSCGEGVGLVPAPEQTWVALLARSLGLTPMPLACAGATVAQVQQVQLPRALAAGPGDVATVFVGPNDLFKAGFDIDEIGRRYHVIVDALSRSRGLVIVGRWHDPLQLYPLPNWLRRGLARRLELLNTAIVSAAESARVGRVQVFDLAAVPELAERESWAVDRVHPSAYGNRVIAHAARMIAAPAQWPGLPPAPVDRTSGWDECRWWWRHGAPWMLKRLGSLAVPVGRVALRRDGGSPAGGDPVVAHPAGGGEPAGPNQLAGRRQVARAGR